MIEQVLTSIESAETPSDVSENLVSELAISRKLANVEKHGIGGITYVTCGICGKKGRLLSSHIHRVHKMTTKEYHVQFPGRKLVCDEVRDIKAQRASSKLVAFCKSPQGLQSLAVASGKRLKTNLDRYGIKSPNVLLAHEAVRKLWKDPEWRAQVMQANKVGTRAKHGVDNIFLDKEKQALFRKKAQKTLLERYGVTNPSQIPGIQEKIRRSAQIQMNKAERLLLSILPESCEFVGDGKFWIRWSQNQSKNPDFIVRPFSQTKAVIELFGEFYHSPDHEQLYTVEYSNVGIQCLVIWCSDLIQRSRRSDLQARITDFISKLGSSETTREASCLRQDKDIVHIEKGIQ